MVKVKVVWGIKDAMKETSFNHPMVKVKEMQSYRNG